MKIVSWLENVRRRFRKTHSTSVNAGATQFVESSGRTTDLEAADLVVGLDFGTVCTKVVIRSPFAFGSRATAVEWPGGDPRWPYLLPTVLHEADGRFDLAEPKGGPRRAHTDLKVLLMEQPSSPVARARAAAYLGLALRAARRWFLDTQREVYGGFRLRWALNLGVPSAGYDDESVRGGFSAAGRAAWVLSLSPNPPTVEAARDALEVGAAETDSASRHVMPIDVIPEIAAEVVGYAGSKHRRDGLHVIIDVGGSTIDICGFVLHAAAGGDEDRYELLTAIVERLGLRELHLRRLGAVEGAGERLRSDLMGAAPSRFEPIPPAGRFYMEDPSERLRKDLDNIDEKYTEECTSAVMRVLMDLRKRRDPHSPNWESGLPVFVGGGGGRFGLVSEALRESGTRLRRFIVSAGGIRRIPLPVLGSLSNRSVPPEMAGRLDAAYGLSFESFEVGTISRPGEIEDVPARSEFAKPEIVGKEQV